MARPKLFNREELHDLLEEAEAEGKSIATLARETGISTSHMYHLIRSNELETRQITKEQRIEVLEDQRETGEPIELVAYNALVKPVTLRAWASRYGIPLRCTRAPARRAWWRRQLLGVELPTALLTMQMDNLPPHLAVPAYHMAFQPPTPLLWGGAGAIRTLHEIQYPARGARIASLPDGERLVPVREPTEADQYFYGHGKRCWAITEKQYRYLKQTHQLREIG